ncbi:hypothetical protein [Microbulbifer marinus]|uniref:Uncharacterized protein n=1 Tax=Microbulbifer marinus TaxID=658218 RepID=A0A1H3Z6K9_9GAMM|nr:hypothetical protein [Microbulbifer marinus]SEA19277.1 hypothetical protein SAMN05216562_2222 [Microbulbifer marinus]
MKGVIFTGFLFAAVTAAGSVLAASGEHPLVAANQQQDATEKLEMKGEQRHEALLQDAKRSQNEALLQRQMYQLEQLRRQAERDAARAEKLQRFKENS